MIVMMSAHANVESAVHALQSGAHDYLRKPFQTKDLLITLDRCFGRLPAGWEKVVGKTLREREDRFPSAFDRAPIGMAVIKEDRRLVRVNRALCDMLGYLEEELTGRTLAELTHGDDRYQDSRSFKQLFDGKIPFFKVEKRLIDKSGRMIQALITKTLVENAEGTAKYGLIAIENITEQRWAEEALLDSEEQFRTVFMTNPDPVAFGRMKDKVFLNINKGFTKVLGYKRTEVLGRTDEDLDLWLEAKDRKEFFSRLRRKGQLENFETMYRKKNNREIIVSISANTVDLKGEKKFLAVIRDITTLKTAEAARGKRSWKKE
jgi:PAS domain S-box-containing protein